MAQGTHFFSSHDAIKRKTNSLFNICVILQCISLVALKITQSLTNKQSVHCNGKIVADKNSNKLDLRRQERNKQKELYFFVEAYLKLSCSLAFVEKIGVGLLSAIASVVLWTPIQDHYFFRFINFSSNFGAFARNVKSKDRKMQFSMLLGMSFFIDVISE